MPSRHLILNTGCIPNPKCHRLHLACESFIALVRAVQRQLHRLEPNGAGAQAADRGAGDANKPGCESTSAEWAEQAAELAPLLLLLLQQLIGPATVRRLLQMTLAATAGAASPENNKSPDALVLQASKLAPAGGEPALVHNTQTALRALHFLQNSIGRSIASIEAAPAPAQSTLAAAPPREPKDRQRDGMSTAKTLIESDAGHEARASARANSKSWRAREQVNEPQQEIGAQSQANWTTTTSTRGDENDDPIKRALDSILGTRGSCELMVAPTRQPRARESGLLSATNANQMQSHCRAPEHKSRRRPPSGARVRPRSIELAPEPNSRAPARCEGGGHATRSSAQIIRLDITNEPAPSTSGKEKDIASNKASAAPDPISGPEFARKESTAINETAACQCCYCQCCCSRVASSASSRRSRSRSRNRVQSRPDRNYELELGCELEQESRIAIVPPAQRRQ